MSIGRPVKCSAVLLIRENLLQLTPLRDSWRLLSATVVLNTVRDLYVELKTS